MGNVEERLRSLGLVLATELVVPGGAVRPFPWVNVRGNRALVSGHGPRDPDGTVSRPLGQVGSDVSLDEARTLTEKATLSMLASLKRELGDLDRITAWCRVFGMVSSAPDFNQQTEVINRCSELILEVFGPEIGRHARSAVGVASLPLNFAVEIEAEVLISD